MMYRWIAFDRPKSRTRWLGLLLACFAVGGCSGAPAQEAAGPQTAPAAEAFSTERFFLPGISGMALVDERTYLFVHDCRNGEEARAGLWRLDRRPPLYQPVPILDEELADGRLADLESIAAVPGRPREFLLLESGAAGKQQQRRVLAHVELTAAEPHELKLLGWENIWASTSELSNCESLVCWRHEDQLMILIADRSAAAPERKHCRAVCGRVELKDDGGLHFETSVAKLANALTSIESPAPPAKSWRGCTDLYLDEHMELWGVSAEDRGDAGPFRSIIFRVGVLKPATGQILSEGPRAVYECAGLKVEALGKGSIGGAEMCYGTDDERYGGVWRPLEAAEDRGAAPSP